MWEDDFLRTELEEQELVEQKLMQEQARIIKEKQEKEEKRKKIEEIMLKYVEKSFTTQNTKRCPYCNPEPRCPTCNRPYDLYK